MAIVKGLPFVYKGVVDVSDCKTSEDVIIKAGLDWTVERKEIYFKDKDDKDVIVNSNFINCRTDLDIALGIIKDRYNIVQNIEAFKFFDEVIGKNKAIWQTAGCFGNGERIFVSAKLPDTISVKDDDVDNYLVFTNSHDGSSSVKILFTPIRIVCLNTLTAAINTSTNFINIRHTKDIYEKLKIADEILGITKVKIDYCKDVYNKFYNTKITDIYLENFICSFILNKDEQNNISNTGHTFKEIINKNYRAITDSEISMRKVNIITDIYKYYFDGVGQKDIQGTMWGILNAVTGYYSNVANLEGSKRMDSLLYGDKARKITEAFNAGYKSIVNI